MTKLDIFESTFKSADKPVYSYDRVAIGRALVVTDLSDSEAAPLLERVRSFLQAEVLVQDDLPNN